MNHRQTAQTLGIGDLIIDNQGRPMFLTQKAVHRRFEYSSGTSHKFWEIELSDMSFTVNYGKIGTSGLKYTKRWITKDRCKREHDKKVNEKIKKGYKEIQTGFLYYFDNPAGKPTTVTHHENDVFHGLSKRGWSVQRKIKI